jgi:hypothetical protein
VKEADQKLGLLNRKSEVCFLIFNAIWNSKTQLN